MLIEFRVKNFKSFKTEQVLSLVSTGAKDKTLPDNIIQAAIKSGKTQETELPLVSTAVIYGANASGKSNLIDAIKFAEKFVTNQHGFSPGRKKNTNFIPVEPFLLSKDAVSKPVEFWLTFILEGVRYQYGFSVDREKVYAEWLIAFPNGIAQTWFERTIQDAQAEKPEYNWHFQAGKYRKSRNDIKGKTRPDALFLTIAAEFNDEPLIRVQNWFLHNLHYIYSNNCNFFKGYTSNSIMEDPNKKHQIANLLREADLGLAGLEIEKTETAILPPDLPADLPDELIEPLTIIRQQLINRLKDSEAKEVKFDLKLSHYTEDSDWTVPFPLEKESFGTQRLFELSGLLLDVLDNGYTLFIDELEANLHPLLVRKLIGFFGDKNINLKGAQLIFTTHNVNLLDEDILRRDQVWFVEKHRDGSSNLYPLTDIQPRKGEALEKNYLEGRYGAIPNLGILIESR